MTEKKPLRQPPERLDESKSSDVRTVPLSSTYGRKDQTVTNTRPPPCNPWRDDGGKDDKK